MRQKHRGFRERLLIVAMIVATALAVCVPAAAVAQATPPPQIPNGGFETGDLSGWEVLSGNAFSPAGVSTAEGWGWGCCFERDGSRHYWGHASGGDAATGRMRSSAFTLSGTGQISFLLGGGNAIDSLYVALVRESDGAELMRATNTQFNDTETLRRVTWDASAHKGEVLRLLVVDEATGGWGHLNLDDVETYFPTPTSTGELTNPDFETGDLTGWTTTGTAFTDAAVTAEDGWGWGCCFGRQGSHHVWGFASGGDAATGTMTSSAFTLTETGQVSFLIGGGANIDGLYVSLVRAGDGAELFRATGADAEALRRVTWDASAHMGQELLIKVVDTATGGWGHLNLDDIRVDAEAVVQGLTAYWPFDEGQGTSVQDTASGIADPVKYVFNDAEYKPSTDPLWKSGAEGHGVLANSLLFDGYSTSVSRPAAQAPVPGGDLTVEAWVAPRAYEWGDEGKPSAIINQHDKGARQGYMLGMGRHGTWTFQIGINGTWQEVWAQPGAVLERDEWSHVAATFDGGTGAMRLYLNGTLVGSHTAPTGSITPAPQDLIIGRHNQAVMLNGIFPLNSFAGIIDEVEIRSDSLSAGEVASSHEADLATFTDGQIPAPDTALDRSRYDGDKYRPQYHFSAPEHWMNEPHAPVYACGQYHLFFQQNQHGPYWHNISWGHQTSPDMVHWVDQPTAIVPTANSVAPDGIWSGSATIGPDGEPALFITAGDDSVRPNQRTGLARGDCDAGADLEDWSLHPDPVTVQDPNLDVGPGRKVRFGEFRDPFVWKEGDTYFQIVGSGVQTTDGGDVGGTALLYTSTNLTDWTYKGPLFTGNVGAQPATGQVWELPVFLPIGGGKHALLVNPWWNSPNPNNTKFVWYWVGEWDPAAGRFVPDHAEPRLFDYGEHFSGPSGFVDEQGRSVVFNIAQDRRTEQAHYDSGWAHNAGLPMEIYLRADGDLGVRPLAEMAGLHDGAPLVDTGGGISVTTANSRLAAANGNMLHVQLEIAAGGSQQYGLSVLRSPDGSEETRIFYDTASGQLRVDRTKSGTVSSLFTNLGVQGGPLPLNGQNLTLDVFVDHSMIEVYANGHKSITTRAYPAGADSTGVRLFADGAATVQDLQVWGMNPAYTS